MKNSKIKLISLFTILCLNIFFVNIDNVKAATCAANMKDSEGNEVYADGDSCYNAAYVMEPGFAMCYYYFDIQVGMHYVGYPGGVYIENFQTAYPKKRHIDLSMQIARSSVTNDYGEKYYAAESDH